jgi:SAM-dependent methyltransferase
MITGHMHTMKAGLARVLDSLGLLLPVFRGLDFIRTLGSEKVGDVAGGLPLPPPRLRMLVSGTADVTEFLERGQLAEQSIREALARAGAPLGSHPAILDFGCGCGRVLRYWRGLDPPVCGTDFCSPAIKWCRANLPFVEVGVNALEPPLNYGDASFDVVYALSVFTHLPVETQLAWRDELRRVLRPGGHMLLTLHGDWYIGQLKPEERSIYEAGGCVVRWPKAGGSNLCSTFHPPQFVRDRVADGWELVEHVPSETSGFFGADLIVLRKPQTLRSASQA